MVTAIAKRKPGKLDQAERDELLRAVLTRQPGSWTAWDKLAADGATDPEITAAIAAALGEAGSLTDDEGRACCWALTFGNPIYFGTVKIPKRAADLEGYRLVMKCRGLFGIEWPKGTPTTAEVQESFSVPRTNGHARNGKAHANGVGNGQLPTQTNGQATPAAGRMHVLEEIDIPVGNIRPSPENPRIDFDESFLEQLGQSIIDNGQLSPVSVRTPGLDGKYEIIDGETRWRAATLKKIEKLRCSVVECTDAEAALARVLSYRQRRDLNPLEEARGLELLLQKYGCSQRELEEKIGVSQGQISNRIRLLKLPKPWQKRVISGEITASQARDLAAWADEPAVLQEVDENHYDQSFDDRLIDAIHSIGHPLKGWDHATGKEWKIDGKSLDLRVKEVPARYGNGKTSLAFNVELAEQLKAAAIEKIKANAAKRAEKSEIAAKESKTPAEKRERAKQLVEQLNKKIYRYKIAWLQQRILQRLKDEMYSVPIEFLVRWVLWFACRGDNAYHREEELQKIVGKGIEKLLAAGDFNSSIASSPLRKILILWCSHEFEGWRTDFKPATVEAFAENAGVDLAKEWRLDEAFLELFTKDGLIELVEEWKLGQYFIERKKGAIVGSSTLEGMKRGEIIAKILGLAAASKNGFKPPKCLLKVKEVSLT